jgi:hypothetical protein
MRQKIIFSCWIFLKPSRTVKTHNKFNDDLACRNKTISFEVLTAVVVQTSFFWDMTPGSPLEGNQHYEGTFHLHLQGRRINKPAWSRSQAEVGSQWITWHHIPEDRTPLELLHMDWHKEINRLRKHLPVSKIQTLPCTIGQKAPC